MSVVTSVVAQNTTGVKDVHHLPISMNESQLNSIIEYVSAQGFKTGMIANINMMKVIKDKIPYLNAPYVMDPVMVTTSGDALINEDARSFLRDELLPMTSIVTPNIPEAEHLLERKIETSEEMKKARSEERRE